MKLGLGPRSASQHLKVSIIRKSPPQVARRCVAIGSKAARSEERKPIQPGSALQSKLTAMMTAVMPLVLALPADAHEYQRYFQLGAPGLAVVLGSLAYAAAAPLAPKRDLATATALAQSQDMSSVISEPDQAKSSLPAVDQTPQTDAFASATDQSPAQATSQQDLASKASKAILDVPEPSQPVAEPSVAAFAAETTETPVKQEENPKFLVEGMEPELGRGRQSTLVFGGQFGRTGSTQQNTEAGALKENPLAKEKGTVNTPFEISEKKPVQVAQPIVGHVIEWSGLDAREIKPVLAKTEVVAVPSVPKTEVTSVQGNVVPLHKSGGADKKDKAEKELVVLASSTPQVAQKAEASGVPAPVATVASAAPLSPSSTSPVPKQASELQAEHKERINGLRNAISSIKSVGSAAPVASSATLEAPPQEAQQKAYDAKVNALKQSAVQKKKEQDEQWQRRASIVEKVSKATQERLQAGVVKPYNAITKVKSEQPSGLAMFNPKVLFGSLLERVVNVWRLMIRAAQRLVGQKPSNRNPEMQT